MHFFTVFLLTCTLFLEVSCNGDDRECPDRANSKVSIARSRLNGDICSGTKENSPAGYSELSPECIESCAKNYKCSFGRYDSLANNCHHLANRLSEVLCRRGTTCPDWCTGRCNDVEYN